MRTRVWFVPDGKRLYIPTVAEWGKVKRLRRTPRVRVALCDRLGNMTGLWVVATGREVRDDPALAARVDQLMEEKYGEIKRQLATQAAAEGRVYTMLESNYLPSLKMRVKLSHICHCERSEAISWLARRLPVPWTSARADWRQAASQ